MVYSTDRSNAVVPVLVLLFLALWFILRGDLFYVLPCVILFLCFSVLFDLRLPRLWKRDRPLASYGLPSPSPRGNFVDHVFLIAYYLASILQHVSTLAMGALPSNSLLHLLSLQKL